MFINIHERERSGKKFKNQNYMSFEKMSFEYVELLRDEF
jgi:hypothetical protein